MQHSFLSSFASVTIAVVLFIAIILTYGIANRIAKNKKNKDSVPGDFGPVEGALLGLLALLLAFTFSMSASRHDMRRQIIVDEANNIGTAILRADLYADSTRQLFRTDFAAYVEARIAYYSAGMNEEKTAQALELTNTIAAKIWNRAAVLAHDHDNLISSNQMIPALNSMIDIVTTRVAGGNATVPDSILWMLFMLCLVSSFIIGYNRKEQKSSRMIIIVFSLMISASVFLILDLDRPRQGLINMDASNSHIIELREMFK